ncbi:MAG: hypothetical protein R2703_12415 [Micropruina glycogenica]|jgi:hypothetical protein|uniref:Uncharacterized protein n=1 Tax=Micropruina glycogenica TaxID=75385 RepID=A0A2N9JNJ7_9ACTN|nr:hypothetical protein [Micropruina glycogenica]MCB0891984.1 hypothetical protein [Propionibacteriaceae bacterium]SPD88969.1 protein of unknown function [Micropruina glycogenica]
MVLLDLADASWFPLVMVLGLGVVMYVLYRSMRHEMGKITVPDDPEKSDDTSDQRSNT